MTPKTKKILLGTLVVTAIVGYLTKDKWVPVFKAKLKTASDSTTLTDVVKPMSKAPLVTPPASEAIPKEVIEKEKTTGIDAKSGIRELKSINNKYGFIGTANLDNRPS